LYYIEADVELPCEEYEYDRIIPRPRTVFEYEARDIEDEESFFSSFTYLIGICRISGFAIGLQNLSGDELELAVANVDAMLVNWKLHLPRGKQDIFGKNQDLDELMFQAHSMLQSYVLLSIVSSSDQYRAYSFRMMLYIHRPLSQLYQVPTESISNCASLPSTCGTNRDENASHWLHTRKCLEAARTAVELYALPIPIFEHSPLGIHDIVLSILANTSACAYVLQSTDWYHTRERIRLGLGGLKKFGEVWATSRQMEREMKRIARGALYMSQSVAIYP
jgi:hypothetical protein